MIKAIFYDFDGVILDTVEIKGEAFIQLFKNLDNFNEAKIIDYHAKNGGMPRYEKIKNIHEIILNKKISNEHLLKLCDEYSKIVFENLLSADWIEGSKNFIRNHNKEYKQFIISAAPEFEINKIVSKKNIRPFFIEVLGSPKNKVDHINDLLDKYNLKCFEVLFIGDSIHDYYASDKTEVNFIGLSKKSPTFFPSHVKVVESFKGLFLNNGKIIFEGENF